MDQATLLDTEKREKEIEQEYLSSLADLNVNSKPLINMLTILAEENLEYAHIIVAAVEKHLEKVVPDVKLPILYLVDSIVKNVGKQYQTLFSQVIVNMFCGVFEMVNEKIREKMFNLRQTWNEVFPQSKLYALDIKINSIDPGWPITASLKTKILVNPMFLKKSEPTMQQQLKDKQRELLELQARKLELELFATKRRIEEQEKQLSRQTASVAKEPDVRKTLENSGASSMISGAGVGGILPTTIPPPTVLPKSRIAPVPQSMINMVKTRDPRLAKQQVAAQLAAPVLPAALGMTSSHTSLGPMSVPPPAVMLAHNTMEAPNLAPPKGSSPSVKDRLGARVRRVEAGNGNSNSTSRAESSVQETEGVRNKKQLSSSSSSHSLPSQKSRHDHDSKSRKDRKEHFSSSSSSSTSSKASAKGSGSSSKASSARAGSGSNSDKRKQRTYSNSDSSPQGRKSPHSPGKKKTSSAAADRSNHHSNDVPTKGAEKLRTESKSSPSSAEKGSARPSRSNSSTDSKKQDHHLLASDEHHQSIDMTNDGQDIDLRFNIPEKRIKIDESVLLERRLSVDVDETMASVGHKAAPKVKNITATDEEEAVSAMIAKDIDLRSIPLQLLPPTKHITKDLDIELVSVPGRGGGGGGGAKDECNNLEDNTEDTYEYTSSKKRSSHTNKSDEPTAKKSKAEIIDALFGNEDVDLRQLPIGGTLLEAPATLISGESSETNFSKLEAPRSPLLEKNGGSRLGHTRDKHSGSAKNQEKDKLGRPLLYNKLPDDPIERRRSITSLTKPGDIDLRQMPPQHDGIAIELDDEDNSMDSMDTNIKTIIGQAQEQMEKGEITPEQYNILMKQVIQLNETQKIRQAQRIEHGRLQQHEPPVIRIDDNGSLSGEDDVIVTSVTPALGPTITNDFRGKIHPMDGGGSGVGPSPMVKPFDMSFGGAGVPITSVPPPDIRVQRDPRRQRESKWNRVESNTSGWPNRPGGVPPPVGIGGGPLAGPPGGGIRTGPVMAVPSPWETAPFPVVGAPRFGVPPMLPPIGLVPGGAGAGPPPNGLMQSAMSKINDSVRTINIDGIQREIRFYEETAVIFMNWDEPKEIGFQKGARMVVVDGRETFELGFNEPYKSVSIDNKIYQMRLGAPTRELYIDDSWYECYFGDAPTSIFLDGKLRIFKIAGPAPQVKIGDNRNDLVVGKINMVVDAEYLIPVFLDCKEQTFELNGQVHTLQFADFLLTVLIDEQPYPVDFGKLPKVYRLRGRDYYIRFTSLPNNVQPGNVYIRDMIRTPLYRDLRTPPKDPSAIVAVQPPVAVGGPANLPFPPTAVGPSMSLPPPSMGGSAFGVMGNKNNHSAMAGGGLSAAGGVAGVPPHPSTATVKNSSISTGLDYLTNLMPSMAMQTSSTTNNNSAVPVGGGSSIPGYRIEADEKSGGTSATKGGSSSNAGIPLLANINVEELYKKIVAAGIITKLGGAAVGGNNNSAAPGDGATSAAASKDSKDEPTTDSETTAPATMGGKAKDSKDTKPALPAIEPIQLDKSESLKKRQAAIVHQLFSGMQCSSCGVRFPPEQTMKYSQHLDWHFRQNRRDRDSARKAHSRKWYYDVSDWIQYEEIEDLEEREKNWFETQQSEQGDLKKTSAGGGGGLGGSGGGGGGGGGGSGAGGGDGGGDDSSPNGDGAPQPSCPAGSDEDDRQCHMCHEVFEQFYNEETEDWHLKSAIRVDGSTYHPLCYEDYKASLTMSETTLGGNSTMLGGDGSLDESRKTDTQMETDDGEEGGHGGGHDGSVEMVAGDATSKTTPRKKANSKLNKDSEGTGDVVDDDDDDDDDVIVLPTVEPVVEEILDDDAEEATGGGEATSDEAGGPVPRQPEFQERQIDEDLFIQEPNIEVTDLDDIEDRPATDTTAHSSTGPGAGGVGEAGDESSLSSLLRVKIKEEPKEEDEADEEDALFEDVGTIESSLLEINDDHHSPAIETTSANAVDGDLYEDVIVESIPSPGTESSNQMGPIGPSAQSVAPKPSLDGNVEMQDASQASVVVPNRIKINITKSKATALQSSGHGGGGQGTHEIGETGTSATAGGEGGTFVNSNFSENSHGAGTADHRDHPSEEGGFGAAGSRDALFDELSNDASGSWGEDGEQNGINNLRTTAAAEPAGVAFEETTNVAYERKPALAGIEFNRCPRVTSGSEASGLCAIM